MVYFPISDWPKVVGLILFAVAMIAFVLWLIFRRRPTPEEIERQRRCLLVDSGRLIDGMSTDLFQVEAEAGRTLYMILYTYRIGGVDYECSQDITCLAVPDQLQVGFPCSVRYQPGNPQNSIVLAEKWSGLREGLPAQHEYNDPEPLDTSHLRRRG